MNLIENEKRAQLGGLWATVTINGKTRDHHVNDLVLYVEECNENGWFIEKVTVYKQPKKNVTPANANLCNKR